MATPPQLTHLAFASGFDESQEPELVDPSAAFVLLQNTRQERYGGVTKRLGYATLGKTRLDSTERSAGRRLFMNGTQLCTIDGANIDVRSDAAGCSALKSRVPETTVRLRELPSVGIQYAATLISSEPTGDTVTVGNYVAVAWRRNETSTGVQDAVVALLDATSVAVVYGPSVLMQSDALQLELASYGAYVFAIVFDQDSSDIQGFYLDTTSAASINAGWHALASTIATDFNTSGMAVAFGSAIAITYINNIGGTDRVSAKIVTTAGVTHARTVNTSSTYPAARGVGLSEGSSTLWLSWNEGTTLRATGLDGTLNTTVVAGAVYTLPSSTVRGIRIGPRDSGAAAIYVDINEKYTVGLNVHSNAGSADIDGAAMLWGDAVVRTRPFLRDGRLYAHFTTALANAIVLCDCTIDPTAAPGLTSYLRPVAAPLERGLFATCGPRTALVPGTSRYLFAITVDKSGTTTGSTLAEYDFASPYRWRLAPVNGSTFLSGGVVSVFDGTRLIESGFLVAPIPPGNFDTTGTGDLTMTTGRRYVATFEEVDADGNWHVSGVSSPSALTGAITSKTVALSGAPLSITMRGAIAHLAFAAAESVSSLRVGIWATVDGGAPPYYRLGQLVNTPNLDSWTFTDDTTDADLVRGALLYGTGNLPGTAGAGQDRRAPPGLTHLVPYNGMVVGAQGQDLFFSSQPIDGEGQWWSPLFTVRVDEEITALAVQDGTLLVFSERSVWTVSGDPPADNASSGGLGTPRKLAIDQGCINANSVVTTSMGTFYESRRGLELLSRGQSGSWAGAPVQNTLASFPAITSAVLDTVNGLVRFSLAESQADGVVSTHGRDLVYDLVLQAWVSVDDKRGDFAVTSQASQDAAMVFVHGTWRYGWLGSDGTVYYEREEGDDAAHLDLNSWITMAAETAWFKVSGLQGRQVLSSVMLLARKRDQVDLSLALAYSYAQSFKTARSWTAVEIDALLSGGWPIIQLKHEPHDDNECQAVRVRVADAGPAGDSAFGTGKGATWLGLTLDITPQQGVFDVPEGAT